MAFSDFTNKNIEETFSALNASEGGLSKKQAALALVKFGPNEVKAKSISAFSIFWRQIKSPFFYLLFAAAAISLAIGQVIDSAVIIFVVAANATIGFFHEFRAEKAVFLLRRFIPKKAKVVRDEKEQIIEKKDLVPGDIVILETGDMAPADLRIVKAHSFLADESSLTGESAPVPKNAAALEKAETEIFKAGNIIFAGTSVMSGKAVGVIIDTGRKTVFGKIEETLIREEYKMSAYEKDIFYFSRLILKIVVVTVILIFIASQIINGPGNFFSFLLFCTALIISILPEGLPAVVSFALARGSMQMARRDVVVKRLSAIERLGNIDILCTDKTGTLTKNKLSLEKIVSSNRNLCLLYGILSCGGNRIGNKILNSFDAALFARAPENILKASKKFKIIHELPFDSYRMKSAFLLESGNGEKILVVKGAAESMLGSCSKFGGNFTKKEISEDISREGREGRRVLAVGFKKISKNDVTVEDEKGLTFLGYFVFEDPLKDTIEEAIKMARNLGVKIKIVSGDSREVAEHVAKKMKLISGNEKAICADDLEKLAIEEFDQICEENDVFARIPPELKYKIVKSLQKSHDVGFLGDGVNDAPALKMADVGIAVESSADISKEVSDIVLLKRDLRVIVRGIEDGRNIFANINKYIKCMLASNFGNFYSIAVISLFISYLPMLPIQILLSNLLSDLPLISTVTDTVDADELKRPKVYRLRSVLPLIIFLGLTITIFDFIFFSIFFRQMPATIQTLWFLESVFCEILLVFIIRTKGLFWKAKRPSFALSASIVFISAVVIALPFLSFGQKFAHFVRPEFGHLAILACILAIFVAVSELVKYIYFKRFRGYSRVKGVL